MRETKPPTTTATDRSPTKAKVEKEPRHQQTWVAVEADFSDPVPDDVLDAETSEFGATATSNILQHGPSALLQSRTSATQRFSPAPVSSPTPIPFTGKNFTHIPARGNRALALQPKLTVGAAHDEYEEEADEVADQIMRLPTSNLTGTIEVDTHGADNAQKRRMADKQELRTKPMVPAITPLARHVTTPRQEDNTDETEDKEEATQPTDLVQRLIADDAQIQPKRVSAAESFEMDTDFEKRLDATHDRGAPLSDEIRTFMEPRFQADFSGVRVHADSEAGELNRAVSARAFTLGQDIYLGEGQTDLDSDNGKRLLAHELTHVVQQGHANQLRRAPEDEEQPEAQQTETSTPESAQPHTAAEDSPRSKEQEVTQPSSQKEVEQAALSAKKEEAVAPPPERAPIAKETPTEGAIQTQVAGAMQPGDKAPGSPQEDESFQVVAGKVKQVTAQEKIHAPATVESANAQAAAVPPSNEVTSKAQDRHVQEMEQQKPGEFNAAAFKAALMARIQEIAPKNLQEADEFKGSNKLKSVKDSTKTKVAEGKQQATGPLQDNARKEPDTSGIKPKSVTPLKEPQIGPPPPTVDADQAAPKPKGQSEIETPLQQDSQSLDQRMAEAGVTEEQLEQSNEPEFQAALAAKREAQASATESPQSYRKQETQIIAGAQDQAEASAAAQLNAIHDERSSVLNQVAGLQGETKSSDEEARATVAKAIAPIYQKTKQDVEGILNSLDGSVSEKFDAGAEKARKQFEDYVDQRMKAYKKKRYGGLFGWAKWLKDKLAGMPSEVNKFYEEGRARYMQVMDDELSGIAEHVAAKLNEAKARIAQGRQEIQEYVAQLPENLQQIGAEAAQEMQGQFDELEQSLTDKQTELIDDLAQKYQDNLKEIDARIEELKAANAGLISKAFSFIKNVITTIVSLAAMLAKVLAKAAAAVPKIILHPINFLKNLIKGVKQGLHNFVANIGTHLGQGLISWLTGTMGGAGLQLPEKMDLKGIFHLVLQTLGITWENIRARAVNILGEKAVKYLEKGFQIFKVLSTQGLSGLWEFIKDKIGDLKTMVFGAIKDMVTSKIVKAGMRILASMLAGPAGGFIAAIKTIINIVKWFLTNGKRIMALIDAILDSILAIASGSVDEAAKKIEDSLAKTIPLVLSFLADLVGIGDLSGEIRKILTKVRNPINKAIDWVLKEAKKFAKKVAHKTGIVKDKDQEKIDKAQKEGRDLLHERFIKGGKEEEAYASEEDIQAQAGQGLNEIRQNHGLTELKPVVKKDHWAIKGVIQREPTDTKVKTGKGALDTLIGGLMGEFNEDPSLAEIGIDTGVSLIPVLDQASDVRDIIAHLWYMIFKDQYTRVGRWVGLVFTLIGLVPEFGSLIKSASKFVIKGSVDVLDGIITFILKKIPNSLDLADDLRKFIVNGWEKALATGMSKWRNALNWVTSLWNRISKAIGNIGQSLIKFLSSDLATKVQKLNENLPKIQQAAAEKIGEASEKAKSIAESVIEPVRQRLKVWDGKKRGLTIENYDAKWFKRLGKRRLPKNFEGIDFVAGGTTKTILDSNGKWAGEVITDAVGISEKSIDLRGKSFETARSTYNYLCSEHIFGKLHNFEWGKLKGIEVRDLKEKVLFLRYGPGDLTIEQVKGLSDFVDMCKLNDIKVVALPL